MCPKQLRRVRRWRRLIGADGRRLLQAVEAATGLPWLQEIPAVQTLRQVWAEQVYGPTRTAALAYGAGAGPFGRGRSPPPTIQTPGIARNGGSAWVGYKVHLTETCDDGQPAVMTQVLTPPATTPDGVIGPAIHQDLAIRDLLPGLHRLDGGYVDAE